MALFQVGIDVSRYQGSINWQQVAAAGKQYAIVRLGSSNNGGVYVDPYFLQNVNGAHAAGLRVGAYYYTYARTRAAVDNELSVFLNALEGVQLEYPLYVDVEASSLTSLGRSALTSLVQYALDILYQRKWYGGWYSYTNFINNYLNTGILNNYPLWVADYRATLGYTGPYSMWQYSSTGRVNGISGAVDLDYSYYDFLNPIKAGGYNGYGASGPSMVNVSGYSLVVYGTQTEYFYTANINDVVGYLPVGTYPVSQISTASYNGFDWVVFDYNGGKYWTALLDDRNRLENCIVSIDDARTRLAAAGVRTGTPGLVNTSNLFGTGTAAAASGAQENGGINGSVARLGGDINGSGTRQSGGTNDSGTQESRGISGNVTRLGSDISGSGEQEIGGISGSGTQESGGISGNGERQSGDVNGSGKETAEKAESGKSGESGSADG